MLLRIHIGESDKYQGKPLYKFIVEFARENEIAGATVIRGLLGYGKTSVIHTSSILRLSTDLPIVIEIVDEIAKIEMFKGKLLEIINGGLVTEERVRIISYEEGLSQV